MRRRFGDVKRISTFNKILCFSIFIFVGSFVILTLLFLNTPSYSSDCLRDGMNCKDSEIQHLEHWKRPSKGYFFSSAVKAVTNQISSIQSESSGPIESFLDPFSMESLLRDRIEEGKSLIIITKMKDNFTLAWQFSSLVRRMEFIQSTSALRNKKKNKLKKEEVDSLFLEFEVLNSQARSLHFKPSLALASMTEHVLKMEEKSTQLKLQSTLYSQIAAESIPKSVHCFHAYLGSEWAKNHLISALGQTWRQSDRLKNNTLYHFCVCSDNVLAVSVVVKSLILSFSDPSKLVIHILTEDYVLHAMESWFYFQDLKNASIEIQIVQNFSFLNENNSIVLQQLKDEKIKMFYFSSPDSTETKNSLKFHNPKYLLLLNHIRFYLPQVFPFLEKIVFLDDDVVVVDDLLPLFSINMEGNVNGAVETCLESFHRFYKYLNFSEPKIYQNFDPHACGWAFGMNVFDLKAWRKHNVTEIYHHWQKMNGDHTLWKLGTLPPGLLSFYGLTFPLERNWHVLGLGYDPNVKAEVITEAKVLHWNGNLKPWLKIAIPHYRHLWIKFVDFDNRFISRCNFR